MELFIRRRLTLSNTSSLLLSLLNVKTEQIVSSTIIDDSLFLGNQFFLKITIEIIYIGN